MTRSSLLQLLRQERVSYEGFVITDPKAQIADLKALQIAPRYRFLKGGVKVVYEDEAILVVEKPAGLLTVETERSVQKSLHSILKMVYRPSPIFVVHRLDRESSGLLVFSKTRTALAPLKKALEKREIKREYAAIVSGNLPAKKGSWESYLAEDTNYHVKTVSQGELAKTHYTVMKKGRKTSLLKVDLDTGRKHQIRVHTSEAGHPILGDKRYGGNPAQRMMLHATKLIFNHPLTGKLLSFYRPMPEVFRVWSAK